MTLLLTEDDIQGLLSIETDGIAVTDVAVSVAAYELAREKGLGREITL